MKNAWPLEKDGEQNRLQDNPVNVIHPTGAKERWIILAILLVGVLNGLIYIAIMPPWQHYEEPSHFEYAWMIAQRLSIPERYSFDNTIRRLIIKSEVEHNFWRGSPIPLDENNQPMWVVINVVGGQPLYYMLVAVPLYFLKSSSVEGQLYAGRAVSLLLYLFTLLMAYLTIVELFSPRHYLRWLVPVVIALTPGFNDIMTAVNSDVGAVAGFSFFIYAGTVLIKRGITWQRTILAILGVIICFFMKNTVLVAVALFPVAIVIALLPRRWNKIWLLIPVLLGLACVIALIGWGDAARWTREGNQATPTRQAVNGVPYGQYALDLEAWNRSKQLIQDVSALRGKPVTVGAWIWASQPIQIKQTFLIDDVKSSSEVLLDLTKTPTFFASQAKISDKTNRIQVQLFPVPAKGISQVVHIYYDGLLLVHGSQPASTPKFENTDGSLINWNGEVMTNYIRNPSFEHGWFYVRSASEGFLKPYMQYALSPGRFFSALQDWQVTNGIVRYSAIRVFQTFWGFFGWASAGMPQVVYQILLGVTILALLGAGFALGRHYHHLSYQHKLILAWLCITGFTIWGIAIVRGLFTAYNPRLDLPPARYGFPAVIPVILLFVRGWSQYFVKKKWPGWAIILVSLVGLNFVAIYTIIKFYKG